MTYKIKINAWESWIPGRLNVREGKVGMVQINLPHPSACEPEQSRKA